MYWEPHSSSIDFCESNYLHHPGVVEFHNTWSSIVGISLFGLIGMVWNNPAKELRTFLAYLLLFLIGIGSTGLHLSLHWIYQASDELPMLFMSNILNFLCLEYDAPKGKPNYPNLPYAFAALSLFHTIIYYRHQDNFVIFFMAFAFGAFLHLTQGYKILYLERKRRGPITMYLGQLAIMIWFGFAAPIWFLDHTHCDAVLSFTESLPESFGLWRGITLHVIWHFSAGFGTYLSIAACQACRMEALKMPYRLDYVWGVVPIITVKKI